MAKTRRPKLYLKSPFEQTSILDKLPTDVIALYEIRTGVVIQFPLVSSQMNYLIIFCDCTFICVSSNTKKRKISI